MKDHDLSALIEKYLLGQLEDAEKKELAEWIDASRENQERFIAEIEFHHQLLDSLSDEKREESLDGQLRQLSQSGLKRPLLRHPLMLAASLGLAALVTFFLVFPTEQGVRAEIIASSGTEAFAEDQWLTLDHIKLKSGELRLRLENDVQLDITGPAEAYFHSPMKLELHRGKLTADVGENGKGFTVITKESEVVDLGTRFGVDASNLGSTDVVVFEGEVKVRSTSEAADSDWQSLTSGQAVRLKRAHFQRLFRVRLAENTRGWSADEIVEGDVILNAVDNVTEEQYYQFVSLRPAGMTQGVRAFAGNAPPKWFAEEGMEFPGFLEGADLLQTYHKDRYDDGFEITLEIGQPSYVYVLIDERIESPSWLVEEFEKMPETLKLGPIRNPLGARRGLSPDEEGNLYTSCFIWRRRMDAPGKIKLGPPLEEGDATIMYGIAAKAIGAGEE